MFEVDSSTGVVSSYQEFDYDESPQKYTLTLTATDKGQPPLMGSVFLLFSVLGLRLPQFRGSLLFSLPRCLIDLNSEPSFI